MVQYVERYHVVEDGLSFVGDLSVQEYLGDQVQSADGEEGSTVEGQAVESESGMDTENISLMPLLVGPLSIICSSS